MDRPEQTICITEAGTWAVGAVRGNAITTRDTLVVDRSQLADLDLVLRTREGDIASYSELVSRYQRAVYGIISRIVSSPDDVDDVAQDVFVLAYKAIDRFRGDASFATWIHRIAVNTSLKHIKKIKSKQAMSIDDPDLGLEDTLTSEHIPGPSQLVESDEQRTAVRKAVDQLPDKHRLVVVLRYFEDYSCEDIAKMMDCSVGTVWSRLHYACRKLRGQLDWLERPEEVI